MAEEMFEPFGPLQGVKVLNFRHERSAFWRFPDWGRCRRA